MIIDKIDNSDRYLGLGERIAKTLKYIRENDLTSVKAGKYVIEPDQIVMLVNEFEPSNRNEYRLEGHRKNIDVQYWVSGCELMAYSPLENQEIIEEYSKDTDCIFYRCNASFSKLVPGMFAIYFPSDLHMAIVDEEQPGKVKKIVFKVAID